MTRARVCPQKPAARPVAALIIAAAVALLAGSAPAAAQPALPLVDGLRVTTVAAAPRGSTVRVMQPFGRKGPTSIRFFPESTRRRARPSPNPSDPPGSSYLIKDRDLGQTLFSNLALALSQDDAWSSFPSSFEQRLRQQPGTWGRPDVDTYRDLVLWIEGTDISATTAGRPGARRRPAVLTTGNGSIYNSVLTEVGQ